MNVVISPSHPAVPMRLVCAWCRTELRDGPPNLVTHGICEHCRVQFERTCSRLLADLES